jgi:hypothetical protein
MDDISYRISTHIQWLGRIIHSLKMIHFASFQNFPLPQSWNRRRAVGVFRDAIDRGFNQRSRGHIRSQSLTLHINDRLTQATTNITLQGKMCLGVITYTSYVCSAPELNLVIHTGNLKITWLGFNTNRMTRWVCKKVAQNVAKSCGNSSPRFCATSVHNFQ